MVASHIMGTLFARNGNRDWTCKFVYRTSSGTSRRKELLSEQIDNIQFSVEVSWSLTKLIDAEWVQVTLCRAAWW